MIKKLIYLYVKKQLSLNKISSLVKLDKHSISKKLKQAGIKIRNKSQSIYLAKNILNKTFSRLTVKYYVGHGKYLCKCICGKEKIIRRDSLITGSTVSCGCKNKENISKSLNWLKIPKRYRIKVSSSYSQYKQHAKQKKRAFEISIDKFIELIFKPCVYCGAISKRGFNGLDRQNNFKSYVLSNVVPCCNKCNHAKKDMSILEFEKWVKTIFYNRIKK